MNTHPFGPHTGALANSGPGHDLMERSVSVSTSNDHSVWSVGKGYGVTRSLDVVAVALEPEM